MPSLCGQDLSLRALRSVETRVSMTPSGDIEVAKGSPFGNTPVDFQGGPTLFTKKMIALLVLATILVSGAAMADDGFKIYGKLHTSIDYMSDSDNSQIMMANNTSRFGFKGSKELEENLTFIWQFESAINLAQKGSNTLVTRNSYLGLNGNWGTFLYGIHDTPFKTIGRKATFFFDELGDFRQTTMDWDRRLQDVVVYASPDMSGFGVVLGYMLDQGAIGADENMTAFSGSAAYAKDALYVGVAYEMLSKGFAPVYDMTDPDNPVMTGYGEAQTGIRATAKYDFGTFAVAGLFQALSDVGGVADHSAQTFGLEAKFDFSDVYAVKGAYYMADPDTDTDDDDYALLALGVDRHLSKKTYMYMQYAMTMNGDASMHGVGGPGHGSKIGASAAGESPMGISWGIATKF